MIGLVILVWNQSCRMTINNNETTSLNLEFSSDSLGIFAPHLISTPLYERDMAISPAMDEIVYTLGDYKQTRRALVSIKKEKDGWTQAELLPFTGRYHDIEPFFSHDGKRLYFASRRPIYGDSSRTDYNIWFSDKSGDSWSDPEPLDTLINSGGDEYYPSLSREGHLYFTSSREEGVGSEDIFVARWKDGAYTAAVPLDTMINSPSYEFNAFIDPDEAYIIFGSYGRPDGFGGGDLYISVKDEYGSWTKARNLGPGINSSKLDYCPFVDAKGLNLYLTSERTGMEDRPIKDAAYFRKMAERIENGFGNIYRIGWEHVLKEME